MIATFSQKIKSYLDLVSASKARFHGQILTVAAVFALSCFQGFPDKELPVNFSAGAVIYYNEKGYQF